MPLSPYRNENRLVLEVARKADVDTEVSWGGCKEYSRDVGGDNDALLLFLPLDHVGGAGGNVHGPVQRIRAIGVYTREFRCLRFPWGA